MVNMDMGNMSIAIVVMVILIVTIAIQVNMVSMVILMGVTCRSIHRVMKT